jgi:hypothetical protein
MQSEKDLLVFCQISKREEEQDVLHRALKAHLERGDISEEFLGYVSWIGGEAMNNVFDHGQTLGRALRGGVLALAVTDDIKDLQISVGDLGIGIKESLEKNPQIQSQRVTPKRAIELAISENTSGWPQKRGNGLPDILRIVKAGRGEVKIQSDGTTLTIKDGRSRWGKAEMECGIIPGVIIGTEIKIHDFEIPRRTPQKGTFFRLKKFGRQLSGRDKGQVAYEVLVKEVVKLPKGGVLLIDLTDVLMMNSSFGDQSLGVLLENIKSGHFGSKKVIFTGEINDVTRFCLNRISEIRDVDIVIV